MPSTMMLLSCAAMSVISIRGAFAPPNLKGSIAVDTHVADELVKSRVVAALGGLELSKDDKAPAQAVGSGAGGLKQPVAIQVDEGVLKQLEEDFSPECSKRFMGSLNGEGPKMHTFNEHGADKQQCSDKLQGGICATQASVIQMQSAPDGRKLSQVVEVSGNGCLPKECINQKDLDVLAMFMLQQTKQTMPGNDVELNVDCSKSGGGFVSLGKKEQPGSAQQGHRSSASALGLSMLSLAAILCGTN